MEKLSEVSGFGIADNVEAEVRHNKKVLKEDTIEALDDVSMSDSVEAEVT